MEDNILSAFFMLVLLLDPQTNQYMLVTVTLSLILQFFDTGEKR